MIEELGYIKEQLFDAPKEVKESFNNIVNWFDGSEKKYVLWMIAMPKQRYKITGWDEFKAHKSMARFEKASDDKSELEERKNKLNAQLDKMGY